MCATTIDISPHHTITRGAFGSDYFSLPTCPVDHAKAQDSCLADFNETVRSLVPPSLEDNPRVLGAIITNLIAYIQYLKNKKRIVP